MRNVLTTFIKCEYSQSRCMWLDIGFLKTLFLLSSKYTIYTWNNLK